MLVLLWLPSEVVSANAQTCFECCPIFRLRECPPIGSKDNDFLQHWLPLLANQPCADAQDEERPVVEGPTFGTWLTCLFFSSTPRLHFYQLLSFPLSDRRRLLSAVSLTALLEGSSRSIQICISSLHQSFPGISSLFTRSDQPFSARKPRCPRWPRNKQRHKISKRRRLNPGTDAVDVNSNG
jgi:hypothetical protein